MDPKGMWRTALGVTLSPVSSNRTWEGFNRSVKELANSLNVSEELAGALVVGRFKDGTPVALQDAPGPGGGE